MLVSSCWPVILGTICCFLIVPFLKGQLQAALLVLEEWEGVGVSAVHLLRHASDGVDGSGRVEGIQIYQGLS